MTAAVATVAAPKLSPVEAFKLLVLPPEKAAELHRALPAHIRPERFERNLLNALMQNPKLLTADPRLVYREVSKAAALGLILDPQLGEAYIILVWDGKLKREVPQLRVGYRGLIKLARQSGEVASIYAHAVHERDHIVCELGDNPKLEHKPELFGDRGTVIGYYAVVRYKDGERDFEPMNRADVERIRNRTEAFKAFEAGKIKSTPWASDFDEMARKTAIRRLLKRVPQSPDMADAMAIEDAGDRARNITPTAAAPAATALSASKLDQLEDASGLAAVDVPEEDQGDDYNPETGEVVEQPAEETATAPAPYETLTAGLETCTTSEQLAQYWRAIAADREMLDAGDRGKLATRKAEIEVALREREGKKR